MKGIVYYYKKRKLRKLAEKIYIALLSNPARYSQIAKKVTSGKITQAEATQKNINKACLLAVSFINFFNQSQAK